MGGAAAALMMMIIYCLEYKKLLDWAVTAIVGTWLGLQLVNVGLAFARCSRRRCHRCVSNVKRWPHERVCLPSGGYWRILQRSANEGDQGKGLLRSEESSENKRDGGRGAEQDSLLTAWPRSSLALCRSLRSNPASRNTTSSRCSSRPRFAQHVAVLGVLHQQALLVFQVKVWLGEHYYILSRFLISRMLTVTKIPYIKVLSSSLVCCICGPGKARN